MVGQCLLAISGFLVGGLEVLVSLDAVADEDGGDDRLEVQLTGDRPKLLQPGTVGQRGAQGGKVAVAAECVQAGDDPHFDLRVAEFHVHCSE